MSDRSPLALSSATKPVFIKDAEPMLRRSDTMSRSPLRVDDLPPARIKPVRPSNSLDTSDIAGSKVRGGPFVTQVYRDTRSWENTLLPFPDNYVIAADAFQTSEPVSATFSPAASPQAQRATPSPDFDMRQARMVRTHFSSSTWLDETFFIGLHSLTFV
jgi:hypothetical protein